MSADKSILRIELQSRPGNAAMAAILNLLTLVLGDPDKELAYEKGGRVLILEDTPANIQLFAEVLRRRSWGDEQFAVNRSSPDFQMGISAFGGEAQWSQFLSRVLDTSVTPA